MLRKLNEPGKETVTPLWVPKHVEVEGNGIRHNFAKKKERKHL